MDNNCLSNITNQVVKDFGKKKSYHVSWIIRQRFFLLLSKPRNLDLSYKKDLDLWDCLEGKTHHRIS